MSDPHGNEGLPFNRFPLHKSRIEGHPCGTSQNVQILLLGIACWLKGATEDSEFDFPAK